MNNVLKIDRLTVTAKSDNQVIDSNICLEIERGESLVVLGESGSGKTMICRAVFGLLGKGELSFEGSIELDGVSITEKTYKNTLGNSAAFIPQNPMTAFDPSMKVGHQLMETLRLHRKITKKEAEPIIVRALQSAGLDSAKRVYDSYPHTLSGGMLQRAVVAMAIMMEPQLIVADEPTTALDAEHRESIIRMLTELRSRGTAVLLITHDFTAAKQFGGNAVVMKGGEIIERGRLDDISAHAKTKYCRRLIAASQLTMSRGKERLAC